MGHGVLKIVLKKGLHAVVMLLVDEANVMSPAELMVLVLMTSPVVPDKVIAPCPVMVPPL